MTPEALNKMARRHLNYKAAAASKTDLAYGSHWALCNHRGGPLPHAPIMRGRGQHSACGPERIRQKHITYFLMSNKK